MIVPKTRLKIRIAILCIVILLAGFQRNGFCAENTLLKTGDLFPAILLKSPTDPKDISYLGISGKTPFLISEVDADFLLVEIMNINCGHCRHQAPIYNKLFDLIKSSPEAAGKLKIIAIAAGSVDEHNQKFRNYFDVPYPIIEDPALKVYDAVGKGGVPFTIYVRPSLGDQAGVVVGTHEGVNEDYEAVFREMKALMEMDLDAAKWVGAHVEEKISTVEPILSEREVISKIKGAFKDEGCSIGEVESMDLEHYGKVYSFLMENSEGSTRFFARSVSQPPPCNQCHDVHFIYIFDGTGKVNRFIPVQLTKYGNKNWNNQDIDEMRRRIMGSSIQEPMDFHEEVDAVSSATITSLVIFKNIYDGQGLLEALKSGGWIK